MLQIYRLILLNPSGDPVQRPQGTKSFESKKKLSSYTLFLLPPFESEMRFDVEPCSNFHGLSFGFNILEKVITNPRGIITFSSV